MRSRAHFVLALNAHLPLVRHPEHEFFLEESWYFEAAIECYIPMIRMLTRLVDERVPFGLALSLSPTLLAMMGDPLLKSRLLRHMDRQAALCEAEITRTSRMKSYAPLARLSLRRIRSIRRAFAEEMNCDLVGALRTLASRARGLELITTSATHAFLPNLAPLPGAVRAQVELGRARFTRMLGRQPRGLWLPECGYYDGLGQILSSAGCQYTILESHSLLHSIPRPRHGVLRPVRLPGGVIGFGRDPEFSEMVWSSKSGYPADPAYRDFHSDLGFAPGLPSHVRRHIAPLVIGGARCHTGIKYHAIAEDAHGAKLPYDPTRAARRARQHARHFVSALESRARHVCGEYGFAPVITAAYDAELFGHWWHEGLDWLERVMRLIAASPAVRATAPGRCIDELARKAERIRGARPGMSSWGRGGYGAVWAEMDGGRALSASLLAWERLCGLAASRARMGPEWAAALDQARAELMLFDSSDWAFLARSGTARDYARSRKYAHMENFRKLLGMMESGSVDMAEVQLMRSRTCGLFAEGYSKSRSFE